MKVKNIMFSGFAAAILMGAVAEANAAPVAVASKGYVDSIAGKLSELGTTVKSDLVGAINEVKRAIPTSVQGEIADGTYTTNEGFFYEVKQTDGKVSAEERLFDTEVSLDTSTHTNTAPTTKAVYEAWDKKQDKLDDDQMAAVNSGITEALVDTFEGYATSKQNAFTDGQDVSTNIGFISSVTQTGGAVTAGTTDFDQEVNATTGTHNNTAPTTKAVHEAIEGVRSAIPTNVQGDIEDGTYTQSTGFFNKVTQTDGKVVAEGKDFDQEVNADTGTHNDTAPTTKAVFTALGGKQNKLTAGDFINIDPDSGEITTTYKNGNNITIDADGKINTTFPAMPTLCSGEGVVCVLTSQYGELAWTILTKPVDGTIIDGTAAQTQSLPDQVFVQPQ
ncbi:MAG: hypothetical protein E7007_00445 [Alphaproteobacteria bacterium]|nr:hypothetical protein [Alphaproteobacteria bacterium]